MIKKITCVLNIYTNHARQKGANVTHYITPNKALSLPKWNTSPFVKTKNMSKLNLKQKQCNANIKGDSWCKHSLLRGVGPITAEFVRSEVARGRAIIPNNINHPERNL
jgi:phosphomethylpyrimidine synthase